MFQLHLDSFLLSHQVNYLLVNLLICSLIFIKDYLSSNCRCHDDRVTLLELTVRIIHTFYALFCYF